ncbi:hypothetical protein [Natrarchaeobaculum aegyptiacum]|uniref:Peptidase n=1 Tax=Natrarchaeobaculum aegyptiacum TaxID=745377 RepID=A0A2Z2HU81_9EURY|nr:hypothetical protein [Natrarchaeobaculum aegyptiacum]ARS90801.1 hypothetical protein B1756_14435 [Natrarchaeobaculum aegyptiacum]
MSLLASIALLVLVAVVVGVGSIVAFGSGHLVGRTARTWTDERAVRWLNGLAIAIPALVSIAVWILARAAVDLGNAETLLEMLVSSVLAAVVTGLSGAVVGTIFVFAMLRSRPALPGVENPAATTKAYARYLAIVFVFTFLLGSALLPALEAGPLAVTGLVVVLVFAIWVLSPVLGALKLGSRSPTAAERDRLESLLEEADVDVRSVRVLDRETPLSVSISGPPGLRTLFLTANAFEVFDDETLEAVLVTRDEQVSQFEWLARTAVVVAALVPIIWGVLGDVSLVVGLLTTVGIVLVGFAGTRRLRYRADARAADRVGRGSLVAAYERALESAGFDPEEAAGSSVFTPTPSMGARLERLRDSSGDESATVDDA